MKIAKINKIKSLALASIICALASSCSFVSLNQDAKKVSVVQSINDIAKSCKALGNTTVSVWAKADTFQSQDKVETQLDTLARNQAAQAGADTVVPIGPIIKGQRVYNMYNCNVNQN
jgi:hypothetical protein